MNIVEKELREFNFMFSISDSTLLALFLRKT